MTKVYRTFCQSQQVPLIRAHPSHTARSIITAHVCRYGSRAVTSAILCLYLSAEYTAAVGTAWSLFGLLRKGQAALHDFQKTFTVLEYGRSFSHCAVLEAENTCWCVHSAPPPFLSPRANSRQQSGHCCTYRTSKVIGFPAYLTIPTQLQRLASFEASNFQPTAVIP